MALRDPSPLSDRHRNKWPGILMQLGIESRFLTGKQTPCPICGGKDRFRFDNLDGRGTWICNTCGAGDGPRLLELKHGWSFKDLAAEVRRIAGDVRPSHPGKRIDSGRALELCRDLWRATQPAGRSMVEDYLRHRGYPPPYPPVLRYCSRTPIRNEAVAAMPAMIALVQGPDGSSVSLHRTFLQDGRKAPISKPRQLMPGMIPDGSAVRLASAAPDMGAAEGIETALGAALLHGLPVWATLNATMLEKFAPPPESERLHIFGDNDAKFAGQAAAYRLAHRVACRDGAPEVHIHIPAAVGHDWDNVREARNGQ